MLKKALKGTAKFLLWLAHGVQYHEYVDPTDGRTYYGFKCDRKY